MQCKNCGAELHTRIISWAGYTFCGTACRAHYEEFLQVVIRRSTDPTDEKYNPEFTQLWSVAHPEYFAP